MTEEVGVQGSEIPIDDGVLLERIAGGDKEALALFYDRYAGLLLAAASRFFTERRDAEDLTHDVFLEIWRKAETFDPARGSVRTWVLMRLRSRALDRRKSAHATRVVPMGHNTQTLEQSSAPRHGAERHLDQQRVQEALFALPQKQRAVLELAYLEGRSSSEIAQLLSIPVGTVKSRVAAGMRHLRQVFAGRKGAV